MHTGKFGWWRNSAMNVVGFMLGACMMAVPVMGQDTKAPAQTPEASPSATPEQVVQGQWGTNKLMVSEYDTNMVAQLADPAQLAKMTTEELQARVQEIMQRLDEEAKANSALRRDAMNLRREAEKTSPEVKAIKLEIKALNDKIAATVGKEPGVAAAMEKANACQSMIVGLTRARALILGTIAKRERAQTEADKNTPPGNLTTNKTDNSMNNTKRDGGRQ